MTMNTAAESYPDYRESYPDHREFSLENMQKMAAEDMVNSLERDLQEKRPFDAKGNFEDITRPLVLNEDEIFYKNYYKAGKDPLTLKKFLQKSSVVSKLYLLKIWNKSLRRHLYKGRNQWKIPIKLKV